MPTIPLPNRPDVQRAQYAGVGASAEAATAPTRALGSVVQGIGQIGSAVGQLAERKAQAKNSIDALGGQGAMEKEFARFQHDLANDQGSDPEKWTERWQQRLTEVRASVLTADLAPIVRDHLTARFKDFEQKTTTQVQGQADVQFSRTLQAKGTAVVNDYADKGDMNNASIALHFMNASGVLRPEEFEKLQKDIPVRASIAQINASMSDDAIHTLELLKEEDANGQPKNWTALNPQERLSATRAAEQRAAHQRQETLQGLTNRNNQFQQAVDAGTTPDPDDVIKPEELQKLVDQKQITPTEMRWTLQQQKGLTVDASKRASTVSGMIRDWIPSLDANHAQKYAIIQAMHGLPATMVTQLTQELDAAESDSNKTSAASTPDAFSYLKRLHDRMYADAKDVYDRTRDTRTDFSGRQKAEQKADDWLYGAESELRDWLSKNPKATPQEVREHVTGRHQDEIFAGAAPPTGEPVFNKASGLLGRSPADWQGN